MLSRLFAQLRQQWLGALALFLALTGGVAYAADTIGTADVIDNSLLSTDLKNNQGVKTSDVTNGSLAGIDVAGNTLTGANIDESSLGQVPSADLLDGVDSTGFVRGDGRVFSHVGFTPAGNHSTVVDAGYATVRFHCSADGQSATIGVTNNQSEWSYIHVYADTGNANPDFNVVTAAAGEVTVATLGGAPGLENDVATLLFGGETDTPGRVMTVTIGAGMTASPNCYSSTHANLVG